MLSYFLLTLVSFANALEVWDEQFTSSAAWTGNSSGIDANGLLLSKDEAIYRTTNASAYSQLSLVTRVQKSGTEKYNLQVQYAIDGATSSWTTLTTWRDSTQSFSTESTFTTLLPPDCDGNTALNIRFWNQGYLNVATAQVIIASATLNGEPIASRDSQRTVWVDDFSIGGTLLLWENMYSSVSGRGVFESDRGAIYRISDVSDFHSLSVYLLLDDDDGFLYGYSTYDNDYLVLEYQINGALSGFTEIHRWYANDFGSAVEVAFPKRANNNDALVMQFRSVSDESRKVYLEQVVMLGYAGTANPTTHPTREPTSDPTTAQPSSSPTTPFPTWQPSKAPTDRTAAPSPDPSAAPTIPPPTIDREKRAALAVGLGAGIPSFLILIACMLLVCCCYCFRREVKQHNADAVQSDMAISEMSDVVVRAPLTKQPPQEMEAERACAGGRVDGQANIAVGEAIPSKTASQAELNQIWMETDERTHVHAVDGVDNELAAAEANGHNADGAENTLKASGNTASGEATATDWNPRSWFDENLFFATRYIDKYYDIFMQNGYDNMDAIAAVTRDDLVRMNIVAASHQKEILKAIEQTLK